MPTALATAGAGLFASAASSAINRPDDSAQNAQLAANERSQEYIQDQSAKAERSGEKLFDLAQQNLLTGNSASFNLQKDAFNPQLDAINQGNYNAQSQIAGGLPQIQNALLGLPIDYSAFQPKQVTMDTSFLDNHQLTPKTQINPDSQEGMAMTTFNDILNRVGVNPVEFDRGQFGSASQALAFSPQEMAVQRQLEAEREKQKNAKKSGGFKLSTFGGKNV